jgi:phosphopantothenate synthetase
MSDQELQQAFTAAVKAYAARMADAQSPVIGVEKNAITATEAVIAICELMRAADLNPFDVAMWYRRPLPDFPGEAR